MKLVGLEARGKAIAAKAAERRRAKILKDSDLPEDVSARIAGNKIIFSGSRLKQRYVTDSQYRSQLR